MGTDGEYHWFFTQVVRVESPYTDHMLEITLSRNIDEERRHQKELLEKEQSAKQILEEALKKAENASQAKSDFLSRMSHDIRTPMNAIVGMTELARFHIGDEEKTRDYLEKIGNSGTHLLGLINEVLDVSRIESGAAELEEVDFDLRKMVTDIVEMVRFSCEKKHQSLSVKMDEQLHPKVRGDERKLKQVLVNILENASKYTRRGGHVAFTVEELEKNVQNLETYRFVIEDDGIGMKPEYLEHIFEPFSRAEDSRTSRVAGTGLGMTIVRNLVSMMGGDIRVESEYGKGSRFIVTLCLAKSEAENAVELDEDVWKREPFPGLRVLLVDDNELNSQIASEMLELLGAVVETAANGKEAVEAILANPPLYYDIVFMDVQMPVMNGYDAAKAIRDSGKERIEELPIIAMTADAFVEDIRKARLAGMNGHLAKPISVSQLKNVLTGCSAWKIRNQGGKKEQTC